MSMLSALAEFSSIGQSKNPGRAAVPPLVSLLPPRPPCPSSSSPPTSPPTPETHPRTEDSVTSVSRVPSAGGLSDYYLKTLSVAGELSGLVDASRGGGGSDEDRAAHSSHLALARVPPQLALGSPAPPSEGVDSESEPDQGPMKRHATASTALLPRNVSSNAQSASSPFHPPPPPMAIIPHPRPRRLVRGLSKAKEVFHCAPPHLAILIVARLRKLVIIIRLLLPGISDLNHPQPPTPAITTHPTAIHHPVTSTLTAAATTATHTQRPGFACIGRPLRVVLSGRWLLPLASHPPLPTPHGYRTRVGCPA
ncbi:hypothetical protein PAPYR_6037 [Paratrimastix pyriformis]|uniref:Uncharacterized protein n=1 Tax=Paratrimastix pyriformis TaxID=342808 RepID=A0ABQ8UJ24_9EUKA|nr:hypothetical protein PAPYR_6037 [Paratrimastix pyriformis]